MGKFIITVSGSDCKGEIISEVFHVTNGSNETQEACKELYNEMWADTHYAPRNIEVDVLDVEAAARNFKVNEKDMEDISRVIRKNKTKKSREEAFREMWKTMTQAEKDKWIS